MLLSKACKALVAEQAQLIMPCQGHLRGDGGGGHSSWPDSPKLLQLLGLRLELDTDFSL